MEESLLKMHVALRRDEFGWPPVASESVWIKPVGRNKYSVENVPFFIPLLAFKDLVEGYDDEGIIRFRRHLKSSGYATVRIICKENERRTTLLQELEGKECEIEGAPQFDLLAIGIPAGERFAQVMAIVRTGYVNQWWDFEESCLPAKPRRGLWNLFTGVR